jgi:hypothetical protein
MPELRNVRALAAVPRTETDSKNRDATRYAGELRHGHTGQFRGAGRVVELRNGMPEARPYTYRGTGHDAYGCKGPGYKLCGCM